MQKYQITITSHALKQMIKFPVHTKKKIQKTIDALAFNPRPIGVKKLAGLQALFRLRVGDYRIIYSVEDKKLSVLVCRLGHRKDVYRKSMLFNDDKQ